MLVHGLHYRLMHDDGWNEYCKLDIKGNQQLVSGQGSNKMRVPNLRPRMGSNQMDDTVLSQKYYNNSLVLHNIVC